MAVEHTEGTEVTIHNTINEVILSAGKLTNVIIVNSSSVVASVVDNVPSSHILKTVLGIVVLVDAN